MQILGRKFVQLKGGAYKVTEPSGDVKLFIKEDGEKYYNRLVAQKKAPVIFEHVMSELGIKIEDAHLLTINDKLYDKNGKVRTYYLAGLRRNTTEPFWIVKDRLEHAFSKEKINLSFDKTFDFKHKIEIGGNVSGITGAYISYLKSFWQPCTFTREELFEHVKKHNIRAYREVRGGIEQMDVSDLVSVQTGSTYTNRGYGSQASTMQENVGLKMDQYGNILVTRSVLIYD